MSAVVLVSHEIVRLARLVWVEELPYLDEYCFHELYKRRIREFIRYHNILADIVGEPPPAKLLEDMGHLFSIWTYEANIMEGHVYCPSDVLRGKMST